MAICSAMLSGLVRRVTRSTTAAWHSSQVTALEADTAEMVARVRTRTFMLTW